MKKILFLMLMTVPAMAFSQGLLNKLKNKVKSKAEQRVEKNVDKSLDKGFDKVEDAAKPNTSSTAKKETPAPEQPAVAATEKPATPAEPSLKSYSRFDFVPGDSIVYTENFEQDVVGELPQGWNTTGNGEIVTLNNFPGKWMKLYQNTDYLTSNAKEFGENYTVEFDVIMVLKYNGHFYPYFSVAICSSAGEPTTDNEFLKSYKKNSAVEMIIYPAEKNYTKIRTTSYLDTKVYYKGDDKTFGYIESRYGKPVHVAIQVQKERMRIWIDQEKLADFPKAVGLGYVMNQLQFQVHPSSYKEDQYGMYIGNLKVAKGIPDTRHKLIEEGKFSTTGILFDINSDVIKPESYGVMKGIANVLKENADVKVKIIGHTDSDGNDAANLSLSQKRAASVIKLLSEEFGIEATRLQSDGKGETQPVGDNKTKEGKAANRRVEFIKLG